MENSKTIKYVLIAIIIGLAILFLYNKQENADFSGTLSNEALQNIAKVYADKDGTVTFNNVRITGNLDVKGNLDVVNGKISGKVGRLDSPNGNWYLRVQDDGLAGLVDGNNVNNVKYFHYSGSDLRANLYGNVCSPNGEWCLRVQSDELAGLVNKNNVNDVKYFIKGDSSNRLHSPGNPNWYLDFQSDGHFAVRDINNYRNIKWHSW